MKIVHAGNANSIFIRNWVNHFAQRGDEVHVISFFPFRYEGNVTVHIIPRLLMGLPYGERVLGAIVRRIIDKINPDVIHGHYTTGYGCLTALANRHPLVIQAWGSDVYVASEQSEKWKKRTALAFQRADIVITASDALTDYIKSEYDYIPSLRTIPPIGIDLYRQDVVTEAVSLLRDRGYNIRYISAPSGESKEKMAELYRISDCVVSIPYSDQFASTLQEAMACGCIPIVADLPAYHKYLKDGYNAIFVTNVWAERVSEAIMWCRYGMADYALKEYRERNRAIAEREFDWNKCIKGLEEIYEEVL